MLHRNPWDFAFPKGALLQMMITAAYEAEATIASLTAKGEVPPVSAFTIVLLDPTLPYRQTSIEDLVMAVVYFGETEGAEKLLPFAVAKAKAHVRLGGPTSDYLDGALFRFGSDDVAWAGSAEHYGAIAAGSGLYAGQDEELALDFLVRVMDGVHGRIQSWHDEQLRVGQGDWFGQEGSGLPQRYRNIVEALGLYGATTISRLNSH